MIASDQCTPETEPAETVADPCAGLRENEDQVKWLQDLKDDVEAANQGAIA